MRSPSPTVAAGSSSPARGRELRGAAVVALAALAAFGLSLRSGFAWDDVAFVPGNPTWASVSDPWAFFGSGLWSWAKSPTGSPLYRPMSVALMWALDRVLGPGPAAWHAVAVVLHAADSVLVYLLARRIARGRTAALAAGLLFAVHPVHVEAVAWATSAYVHAFAAAFVLLAAHAQLSHARSGRIAWLAAATVLSTLALLTLESTIAVPLLLAGLTWVETRRRPGAAVLVAAAVPIAATLALRAAAVGAAIPVELNARSLLTALVYTLGYARHLVLPWPQGVHFDVHLATVATAANLAIGSAALLAVAVIAARLPRDDRGRPALALAWILASLAPLALAATNARPQFAPRGLYLPSIGLALLVAWAVDRLGDRPRPALVGVGGAVLALSLVGCVVATHAWRDEVTVLERMVETDPQGSAPRLRLGMLLEDRGEGERAREHLEAALRVAASPRERAEALEKLGAHHGMAGRLDLAEPLLLRLVEESPGRATAWQALGNVAYLRGDLGAARSRYLEALRLDPRSHEVASNLALVSRALGDGAAADAYARLAASLRPAP